MKVLLPLIAAVAMTLAVRPVTAEVPGPQMAPLSPLPPQPDLRAPLIDTGADLYIDGQLTAVVRTAFNSGLLRLSAPSVELISDTPSPSLGVRLLFLRAIDAEIPNLLSELARNPDVITASRNRPMELRLSPNDPFWPQQLARGAGLLGMSSTWDAWRGRFSTRVAVLDSGVNQMTELFGRVLPGRNFTVTPDNEHISDPQGHGSSVASVAAASLNNASGIAGVAPGVGIVPVKVCTPWYGGEFVICPEAFVALGLQWVYENRNQAGGAIQVVNMSFGTGFHGDVNFWIDALNDEGLILVGAAGNDGDPDVGYPAERYNVIAVAGTDYNGNRDPMSNYGAHLDFAAPFNTYALNGSGAAFAASGTTYAAAAISGLAALFKSHAMHNPDPGPTDLGSPSAFYNMLSQGKTWNQYTGYGVPQITPSMIRKEDCHSKDFNGDFEIDIAEAQAIAFRYGSFYGHATYHTKYDLEPWTTRDWDIDIKDLQFMFGRMGYHCMP